MWCLCKNGQLSAHKVVTTKISPTGGIESSHTRTWVECDSGDCPYMEGRGTIRKHTKAHFDGNKITMDNSFVYLLVLKNENKGQRNYQYVAAMFAVQNNESLADFKAELRKQDPNICNIRTCDNLEEFVDKMRGYATEAAIISEEFEQCRV